MWWWVYFIYLAFLIVFGAFTNPNVFPEMLLWVIPDAAIMFGGYLFLLKKPLLSSAIQQLLLLTTVALLIVGFLISPSTGGNFAIISSLLGNLTCVPSLYVLWLLSFADGRVFTNDFGRSLPWQYKSDLLCWKISKFLYLLVSIVLVALGAYFMREMEISTVPFLIVTSIFGIPLLFNNPISLLFGALWGLAIGILSPISLFTSTSSLNPLVISVMLGLSVVNITSTAYFSYTIYALMKEHYAKRTKLDTDVVV